MIKYERLQNYCYDCGRIGHEARNCKYPAASKDEDDTEGRAGNGLGTPHVRTKEEMLVVHDRGWDEGTMVQVRPPAVTAEPPTARRVHDDNPRKGSNISPGEKSAATLWRSAEKGNNMGNGKEGIYELNSGQININDPVKAHMEKGITIVEIPTNMEASITPPFSGEIPVHQLCRGAEMETNEGNGQKIFHELSNGQININDPVKAHMEKGIIIVDIPTNMEASITPPFFGEIPVNQLWRGAEMETNKGNGQKRVQDLSNGQSSINDLVKAHMEKEITIVEIPTNMEAGITPPSYAHHSSPSHNSPLDGPNRNYFQTHIDSVPATSHHPKPVTLPCTHNYRVDFPDKDEDPQTLILPISGLSPISAVTKGLNRIHLKRHQDPLKEDQLLNPTKKRLLFLEQASETTPIIPIPTPTTIPGAKSVMEDRSAYGKIGGSPHYPHVLDDQAVEAILTIPIPRAPTDDRQRWLLSKNGAYSVKSGYYSLISTPTEITPTVRTSSPLSSELWKATWKVKTSPKVVNFLWRVLSDAIASSRALVKRKRGTSESGISLMARAPPEGGLLRPPPKLRRKGPKPIPRNSEAS
ncbi:hypothetical protein K1719_002997 [Acacia pycnantha]|nr:hypothetical protein K1719_002997 [Acacia pycnantha]